MAFSSNRDVESVDESQAEYNVMPHLQGGNEEPLPDLNHPRMAEFFRHLAGTMSEPSEMNFEKMRKMGGVEFEGTTDPTVGDKVFLKVSPWKKIMRFGQKGKLSPRFIGPYEILERIGPIAYKLALPPELGKIHNVFHVSMLRKYRSDPSHVLPIESIEVNPDLTYEEEPIQILAREIKELRNKRIPLMKVLWRNHSGEEATWEREVDMRVQYPHLFRD
uniref:Uncharacterized protein LOC104216897 n=1 Tax=Nicotiana sylvestris TaxID=4096 RepID=A0A1U7VK60_NICSY|nr:PREDICTED: uncharacterized protein LOC104216897 [Nicotiana sylvestris]